jgi:transposase
VARDSVRAIAKAQGCSVAQVNRVIDAWAEEAIDDQSRKRVCVAPRIA